ncbi:MAG: alpha-galactosidase, partial [Bacteroidetes bacterium]|nr:alpha-galactosidase [Bacteroidota bacterium]
MFVKSAVLCITLFFVVPAFGQNRNSGSRCEVRVVDGSVNIYYGGKARLTGGLPVLQLGNSTVKNVSSAAGKIRFETSSKPIDLRTKTGGDGNVVSLFLSPNGNESDSGNCFLGLFFRHVPGFKEGVALWRYGGANCWTEPLKIDSVGNLKSFDIQFFYWRYSDGVYGVFMPLSGRGYRTTLGKNNGSFGCKSVSYFDGMNKENIPQMAIGFGRNPYKLFAEVYREGLASIGKSEDLVANKTFPKIFDDIGWCSWNASVYGRKLSDSLLLNAAKDFADAHFPMKWFIIDDGWFNDTKGELNSFQPDSTRFPGGFKPVIDKLKREYHIDHVGVWHAINGYWNGINPDSPLGKEFKRYLFFWPSDPKYAAERHYFVKPDSKGITKFYEDFHKYLSGQGVSFVKVDNQEVTQWLAPGNFPIFTGAEEIHKALNASVAKYFHNTIINCMGMTPDAYLNFGSTSVARAEDDYGPEYDTLHTRNFWFQKAGQHVLQEIYNSIYFSKMVYPDFDEFESINPAAPMYAIADAINNGPSYITDKVGQHDFSVLTPLVYSDGTLLRAVTAPMPTEDCLFNVDAPKPFKAFSMDVHAGLLAIWNCVDSNIVSGSFKPSDVNGIKGDRFAVYEYFGKSLTIAGRDESIRFSLGAYGYKLYYVVPLTDGNGVIGLVNKYNAPAAVVQSVVTSHEVVAVLRQGGEFAAALTGMPASVKVNGKNSAFIYNHHLLTVHIPV